MSCPSCGRELDDGNLTVRCLCEKSKRMCETCASYFNLTYNSKTEEWTCDKCHKTDEVIFEDVVREFLKDFRRYPGLPQTRSELMKSLLRFIALKM